MRSIPCASAEQLPGSARAIVTCVRVTRCGPQRGLQFEAVIRRSICPHARRLRSAICATLEFMDRSLHVRLDESSAAALDLVRASGISSSEAVRTALREAAERRRQGSAICEEVRAVAADEADRQEMALIREQMAELAPPGHD